MSRLSPHAASLLAAALEAGQPIPSEVFLESWGVQDSVSVRQTASVMAECVTPADRERLLASDDLVAIRAGIGQWVTKNQGRARRDLLNKQAKTVGTKLEKEIRASICAAAGRDLGGNAGNGDDIAELHLDVKTTRRHHPQSGLRKRTSSERVLGVDHHLLVLVYDLAKGSGVLDVVSVLLIPCWATGDRRWSARAEVLRQGIAAGTLTLGAALEELAAGGIRPDGPLVSALTGPTPIPTGELTLSFADDWRVQYGQCVKRAGDESVVDLVEIHAPIEGSEHAER
jgi:hypothetical protein